MSKTIKEIAKIISDNGGRLYLVGGAVRDELLGIDNHDEDYCVTGISHDEFLKLFPEAFCRGKSFEVFDMDGKEFALARTERKTGIGHKGFSIETGRDITILDDLKRRDITINSMAKDVLTGEIIDPYGGVNDLKDKIIRATSDCFLEDPLRAYRAARFACKFNFTIEEDTIKKMKKLKEDLKSLSEERVFDEFRRAINCDKPSLFFRMLNKADILDVHFIEIYKLVGALQPEKYHPEGDAFEHTMLAVDKCAELTCDEKIRFSVLVHDLGKGVTPKEEYPHHYNHDLNGIDEVGKFSSRLKMPRDWEEYGKVACREHMIGGIFYKMTPAKQVSFIERVSKTKIGLEGLELVVESDRNCRGVKPQTIKFAKLGKYVLDSIDGNYIKEHFKVNSGLKFKEKLHEQRIQFLKKLYDNGEIHKFIK